MLGSGDGVGTEEIVGWVKEGDCWLPFPSSWSESDSSNGQSSTLILGRFEAGKKQLLIFFSIKVNHWNRSTVVIRSQNS